MSKTVTSIDDIFKGIVTTIKKRHTLRERNITRLYNLTVSAVKKYPNKTAADIVKTISAAIINDANSDFIEHDIHFIDERLGDRDDRDQLLVPAEATANSQDDTRSAADIIESDKTAITVEEIKIFKNLVRGPVLKSAQIILERLYSVDITNNNELSWNIITAGGYQQQGTAALSTSYPLRNVVAIRIDPFNAQINTFSYKYHDNLTITIKEFREQAFRTPAGFAYHYVFPRYLTSAPTTTNEIVPKPEKMNTFWFRNHIQRIDTLTLSFGTSYDTVVMRPMSVYGSDIRTFALSDTPDDVDVKNTSFIIRLPPGDEIDTIVNYYITIENVTTTDPLNPVDAAWITAVNTVRDPTNTYYEAIVTAASATFPSYFSVKYILPITMGTWNGAMMTYTITPAVTENSRVTFKARNYKIPMEIMYLDDENEE